MAIHITRGNQLYGTGVPTVSAEYYGQLYIDTATNPRKIWVATAENSDGWKPVSIEGHKHNVEDFADLTTKITELVQKQGIEAAIISLRGGNNTWEGDWNSFAGAVRVAGKDVLTKGSSIGDLVDVELTENLATNTLLGWNGSNFIPYAVTGASPSEGGIDFSQYIRKDSLELTYNNSSTEKALAASVAKEMFEYNKTNYSPIDHTHTGFALIDHTHEQYLDKTVAQTVKGSITIETDESMPFKINNDIAEMKFQFPSTVIDPVILGFASVGGGSNANVLLGGIDGTTGGDLTLNFNSIHVPTGGFTVAENKKYMTMPPLKINQSDLTYVGNLQRKPAFDLNNGALVGANQVVFRSPSNNKEMSIMFPKAYTGNGQPTENGFYHYLRLADNEMKTDTALASEAKYISIGGIKIFFSPTDPGKAADEGSLWIKC